MNGNDGYAVFFFPQALEALGEAIKPYLQDGPAGPHVVCNGIDTAGSLVELSLSGSTSDGRAVEVELMVPSGMVRMIVSAHSDEMFGFGPHALRGVVKEVAPVSGDADADAGDAASPAQPSGEASTEQGAATGEDASAQGAPAEARPQVEGKP